MSCTKSSKIAGWKKLLAKYEAQMVIMDAKVLKAMTEIQSYKFDSNEGSQQVKYRDLEEMQKAQRYLQAQIDYYQTKICGQGLTRIGMQRRGYYR